jgi:hypothetical protein
MHSKQATRPKRSARTHEFQQMSLLIFNFKVLILEIAEFGISIEAMRKS